MGIINVTPDSFSDGGRALAVADAVALAQRHVAEGADLLDLGGESSRPGAEPVGLDEEVRRVLPALESILAAGVDLPISIDTSKAEVARRALGIGACIINDITALQGDPEMIRVAAESGAGIVLMHMRGTPQTMQNDTHYVDVIGEVHDHLSRRVEDLEAQGIPRIRAAVDPGFGFAKKRAHNWDLLRHLDRFGSLGCAVLIGTSRKGFLSREIGRPTAERTTASVVSSLIGIQNGAGIVRVHDVGPMVEAISVWIAFRRNGQS
jgi:dihydropteroate synthase